MTTLINFWLIIYSIWITGTIGDEEVIPFRVAPLTTDTYYKWWNYLKVILKEKELQRLLEESYGGKRRSLVTTVDDQDVTEGTKVDVERQHDVNIENRD